MVPTGVVSGDGNAPETRVIVDAVVQCGGAEGAVHDAKGAVQREALGRAVAQHVAQHAGSALLGVAAYCRGSRTALAPATHSRTLLHGVGDFVRSHGLSDACGARALDPPLLALLSTVQVDGHATRTHYYRVYQPSMPGARRLKPIAVTVEAPVAESDAEYVVFAAAGARRGAGAAKAASDKAEARAKGAAAAAPSTGAGAPSTGSGMSDRTFDRIMARFVSGESVEAAAAAEGAASRAPALAPAPAPAAAGGAAGADDDDDDAELVPDFIADLERRAGATDAALEALRAGLVDARDEAGRLRTQHGELVQEEEARMGGAAGAGAGDADMAAVEREVAELSAAMEAIGDDAAVERPTVPRGVVPADPERHRAAVEAGRADASGEGADGGARGARRRSAHSGSGKAPSKAAEARGATVPKPPRPRAPKRSSSSGASVDGHGKKGKARAPKGSKGVRRGSGGGVASRRVARAARSSEPATDLLVAGDAAAAVRAAKSALGGSLRPPPLPDLA